MARRAAGEPAEPSRARPGVGLGGALAAHGAQKLLGWFGGPGREGAAAGFQAMGFPRHEEAVLAASACELGGGLLLATGLATPAASAAVIPSWPGRAVRCSTTPLSTIRFTSSGLRRASW